MKKVLLIALAGLAAVSACAISQNQLNDFKAALEALQPAQGQSRVSAEELDVFVANNGSVVDPVAVYALDNPTLFSQMIQDAAPWELAPGAMVNGVLLSYVRREGIDLAALTDAQDMLVTGGSQLVKRARVDSSIFEQLKANDMTLEGSKLRTKYAIQLAARYLDLSVLDTYADSALALYFDEYLNAVDAVIARTNISDADAYALYASIERRFTPFLNRPIVSSEMPRLRENMDSAYVRARRSLP